MRERGKRNCFKYTSGGEYMKGKKCFVFCVCALIMFFIEEDPVISKDTRGRNTHQKGIFETAM